MEIYDDGVDLYWNGMEFSEIRRCELMYFRWDKNSTHEISTDTFTKVEDHMFKVRQLRPHTPYQISFSCTDKNGELFNSKIINFTTG